MAWAVLVAIDVAAFRLAKAEGGQSVKQNSDCPAWMTSPGCSLWAMIRLPFIHVPLLDLRSMAKNSNP